MQFRNSSISPRHLYFNGLQNILMPYHFKTRYELRALPRIVTKYNDEETSVLMMAYLLLVRPIHAARTFEEELDKHLTT